MLIEVPTTTNTDTTVTEATTASTSGNYFTVLSIYNYPLNNIWCNQCKLLETVTIFIILNSKIEVTTTITTATTTTTFEATTSTATGIDLSVSLVSRDGLYSFLSFAIKKQRTITLFQLVVFPNFSVLKISTTITIVGVAMSMYITLVNVTRVQIILRTLKGIFSML